MRPTWHFVAAPDIRWMLELTAPRVHQTLLHYRRRLGLDDALCRRATTLFERALDEAEPNRVVGRVCLALQSAIALMRSRSWRSHLVPLAVLALQVSVSVLGTVSMCVDRPHTHGGMPAPDCLMHHSQPDGTAPGSSSHGHHHEGDKSTSPDIARLVCSCSSDALTLLTPGIAVIPTGIPIGLPDAAAPDLHERVQSAPDVRLSPLSPPPRPTFS